MKLPNPHARLWRRSSLNLLGFRSIYLLQQMISDAARFRHESQLPGSKRYESGSSD
jgi:hypothetical protein